MTNDWTKKTSYIITPFATYLVAALVVGIILISGVIYINTHKQEQKSTSPLPPPPSNVTYEKSLELCDGRIESIIWKDYTAGKIETLYCE